MNEQLWGLHDGRRWLNLHTFNDHAEYDAPIMFFTEAAALEFRTGVHPSYVVKPITKADWDQQNS